jgi:DNA invertase Pin-like site-specific DNA recombinase
VRVSKDVEEGLSLDAQTERVRAIALARGVTLVDVIVDDGASAKSLHRPGMARLLALVDARAVTVVIVAKLDRLTRSILDLAALLQRFERRDVALVSVAEDFNTGTAMGRMLLLIIVMVSQWEREVISERTREVLQFKKAHGERVGTIPFGYHLAVDGVHLDLDDDEQALIAQIRALKAGGLSTRQIADALNAAGRTTRKGTAWRFQYVARVLASAIQKARVGLGLQQPSLFRDEGE